MTRRVTCIVEGHGEVESLPILVRRIHADAQTPWAPDIRRNDVIRVPRSRLLRPEEFERTVELAARRAGADGAVLVLLDADDDLPCVLAPELLRRAHTVRATLSIAVVLAKREYEAWFLAAARSLGGHIGLPTDLDIPADPEAIRDAKGWLRGRTGPRGYRPPVDQPKLTAAMSLTAARSARSFDKLWRDVRRLLS
jgi:hypothetical protein